MTDTATKPEWELAERILGGDYQGTLTSDLHSLAVEVLRERDLLHEYFELLHDHTGRTMYEILGPRIDKLYMALNARGRAQRQGEDPDEAVDADGDPAKPWNRLVEALSYALVHWMANARWAVLEHREANRLRELVGEHKVVITVDCGEGKHDLCTGTGHKAYLIPQESREPDEPPFNCGCRCHHDGTGVPCVECNAAQLAQPGASGS